MQIKIILGRYRFRNTALDQNLNFSDCENRNCHICCYCVSRKTVTVVGCNVSLFQIGISDIISDLTLYK
jgi:hypothetical protein